MQFSYTDFFFSYPLQVTLLGVKQVLSCHVSYVLYRVALQAVAECMRIFESTQDTTYHSVVAKVSKRYLDFLVAHMLFLL